MEFLKKIVPTIGLLVGIVFVAVGGTMLLSSGLKLAFSHPVPYDPAMSCEYRYSPDTEANIKQTPEEIDACIERVTTEEESRFVQDKINTMIDGAAFLIVGAFFWIMFRKRE